MCAVPMLNNYSASAITQYKIYAVSCYYRKEDSTSANMAYFDLTLHYNSGFTGEKAIATYLCKGGTFRSTVNATSRNIQCTYMGDSIKTNGCLACAKIIAPMSTGNTDSFIDFTSKVIRDINGNALIVIPVSAASDYDTYRLYFDVNKNSGVCVCNVSFSYNDFSDVKSRSSIFKVGNLGDTLHVGGGRTFGVGYYKNDNGNIVDSGTLFTATMGTKNIFGIHLQILVSI